MSNRFKLVWILFLLYIVSELLPKFIENEALQQIPEHIFTMVISLLFSISGEE